MIYRTPHYLPGFTFRRTWLSLDEMEEPDARSLLALWRSKCGAHGLPARTDFEPSEITRLLPEILLIDVSCDPLDFRYRLAGTRTYDIHGIELTGISVKELLPTAYATCLWDDLRTLVDSKTPQYVRLEFFNAAGNLRSYRVLRLPLASDGRTVDRVLIHADFGRAAPDLQEIVKRIRPQDTSR